MCIVILLSLPHSQKVLDDCISNSSQAPNAFIQMVSVKEHMDEDENKRKNGGILKGQSHHSVAWLGVAVTRLVE